MAEEWDRDDTEEMRWQSFPLYLSERLSVESQSLSGALDDACLADPETRKILAREVERLSAETWIAATEAGEIRRFYHHQEEDRQRIKKRNRSPRRGRRNPDSFLLESLEYEMSGYAEALLDSAGNPPHLEIRLKLPRFAETLDRLRRRVEHLEKVTGKPWRSLRRLVAFWDACLRIMERVTTRYFSGQPAAE